MFKKVLIAEDEDFMNISLRATLKELGVVQDNRDYVSYCDDALNRVKKAIQECKPYELLITDLSFLEDSRKQEISSGIELIKAVKEIQPEIKILVFSVDHRRSMASSLFSDFGIDGYVPKTRGAAADFRSAINSIYQDKKYLSPNLLQDIKPHHSYKFTELEKTIVSLLSQGYSQIQVSVYLESNKIKPSSLGSVEKSLKHLKTVLNISTPTQLIGYCKDKGII
jgi:two-component system capsular synthesis response regulator RcsB